MTGDGVWVAYYYDGSAVVMFANEIDCLRWAVNKQMAVKFIPFDADTGAAEFRP